MYVHRSLLSRLIALTDFVQHTFYVVRSAGSTEYNYVNPPQRDTVSTGAAGDNVTIRFTTNNPGPWFLHCHIDFHLEAGFAVIFGEDIPAIADANPPSSESNPARCSCGRYLTFLAHLPAAWEDLCPTYNSVYPNGDGN